MKKIIYLLCSFVVLLLCISVVKTLISEKTIYSASSIQLPTHVIDISKSQRFINVLQKAIQIKTVSVETENKVDLPFQALKLHLKQSFPLVFKILKVKELDGGSLLMHWDSGQPKKPILFLAHLDVVPVDENFLDEWDHPPFSGTLANDFIYGRGSLDDKSSAIAVLAAVESLLEAGIVPTQDVFIALGHDEEIGGKNGAVKMAAELERRNIDFEWILDEGGMVNDGSFFNVKNEFALIGLGEKGFCNYHLTVNSQGGHSSTPPRETSISIMANAVLKVTHNPPKARITKVTENMLKTIASQKGFVANLLMENLWFFSPLVKNQLSKSPVTNATIRTTLAPTVVEAGVKSNVLAKTAKTIVNARILPGDTVESIHKHIEGTISDNRVKVSIDDSVECGGPSQISSPDSKTFERFAGIVKKVRPSASILPFLVVAGTDARHYRKLSKNIYRFIPYTVSKSEVSSIHGVNERIRVSDFQNMILFYQNAMLFSEK